MFSPRDMLFVPHLTEKLRQNDEYPASEASSVSSLSIDCDISEQHTFRKETSGSLFARYRIPKHRRTDCQDAHSKTDEAPATTSRLRLSNPRNLPAIALGTSISVEDVSILPQRREIKNADIPVGYYSSAVRNSDRPENEACCYPDCLCTGARGGPPVRHCCVTGCVSTFHSICQANFELQDDIECEYTDICAYHLNERENAKRAMVALVEGEGMRGQGRKKKVKPWWSNKIRGVNYRFPYLLCRLRREIKISTTLPYASSLHMRKFLDADKVQNIRNSTQITDKLEEWWEVLDAQRRGCCSFNDYTLMYERLRRCWLPRSHSHNAFAENLEADWLMDCQGASEMSKLLVQDAIFGFIQDLAEVQNRPCVAQFLDATFAEVTDVAESGRASWRPMPQIRYLFDPTETLEQDPTTISSIAVPKMRSIAPLQALARLAPRTKSNEPAKGQQAAPPAAARKAKAVVDSANSLNSKSGAKKVTQKASLRAHQGKRAAMLQSLKLENLQNNPRTAQAKEPSRSPPVLKAAADSPEEAVHSLPSSPEGTCETASMDTPSDATQNIDIPAAALALQQMTPEMVAEFAAKLPPDVGAQIFAELKLDFAAKVLDAMLDNITPESASVAVAIARELDQSLLVSIMGRGRPSMCAALLVQLEASLAAELLAKLIPDWLVAAGVCAPMMPSLCAKIFVEMEPPVVAKLLTFMDPEVAGQRLVALLRASLEIVDAVLRELPQQCLQDVLLALSDPDAALLLSRLSPDQVMDFFQALDADVAARMFAAMDPELSSELFQILAARDPRLSAAIVSRLPADRAKWLINDLSTHDVALARSIVSHAKRTVEKGEWKSVGDLSRANTNIRNASDVKRLMRLSQQRQKSMMMNFATAANVLGEDDDEEDDDTNWRFSGLFDSSSDDESYTDLLNSAEEDCDSEEILGILTKKKKKKRSNKTMAWQEGISGESEEIGGEDRAGLPEELGESRSMPHLEGYASERRRSRHDRGARDGGPFSKDAGSVLHPPPRSRWRNPHSIMSPEAVSQMLQRAHLMRVCALHLNLKMQQFSAAFVQKHAAPGVRKYVEMTADAMNQLVHMAMQLNLLSLVLAVLNCASSCRAEQIEGFIPVVNSVAKLVLAPSAQFNPGWSEQEQQGIHKVLRRAVTSNAQMREMVQHSAKTMQQAHVTKTLQKNAALSPQHMQGITDLNRLQHTMNDMEDWLMHQSEGILQHVTSLSTLVVGKQIKSPSPTKMLPATTRSPEAKQRASSIDRQQLSVATYVKWIDGFLVAIVVVFSFAKFTEYGRTYHVSIPDAESRFSLPVTTIQRLSRDDRRGTSHQRPPILTEHLLQDLSLPLLNVSQVVVYGKISHKQQLLLHLIQKEVEDLTDFLPQVAFKHKFDTCAVVGTSIGMLWDAAGASIDAAAAVMRFNDAPTKAYESSVGQRTTVRAMNKAGVTALLSSKVGRDGRRKSPGAKTLVLLGDVPIAQYIELRQKYPECLTYYLSPELRIAAKKLHKKLRERMIASGMKTVEHMKSAYPLWLEGVFFMCHVCKDLKLYGFAPSLPGEPEVYYKLAGQSLANDLPADELTYFMLRAMTLEGYLHMHD
ncbi:hypothetical protein CYMTET_55679 [Cymbomonas tetramitiformis]|uniref:beta-galactoside alpha-(2,6)-sialyltransferase n=1 Tax=Cymbomonas tetramitiformis TaxID=36881 RepID=A0AAE0EMK4_9CHLO|nr:hypothetical protein CYMTET_55679 [Cymbomonas tetramitiformis]